jgi:hypothetical protein
VDTPRRDHVILDGEQLKSLPSRMSPTSSGSVGRASVVPTRFSGTLTCRPRDRPAQSSSAVGAIPRRAFPPR